MYKAVYKGVLLRLLKEKQPQLVFWIWLWEESGKNNN